MKIKNIIICIVVLLTNLINIDVDFKEYKNLKINDIPSINPMDLPPEFGEGAFKTVDEFIKKTHYLDCEWVIYFDYVTGGILKCKKGGTDNVSVTFEEGEFDRHSVASIHNHPKNVLSPPSGLNFNILTRDFEDYELIAGFEYFWILKAKGVHENLVAQMNIASDTFFVSSFERCCSQYNDVKIINRMHDIRYGNQLSKFINDKNINDIQLIRKEYAIMDNSSIAHFHCRKHITDPEAIRLAREREDDPNILSGKDRVYAFYQMMGMEIDYDEIFEE